MDGYPAKNIAGLEYWIQLIFNFTPVNVYVKCRSGFSLYYFQHSLSTICFLNYTVTFSF